MAGPSLAFGGTGRQASGDGRAPTWRDPTRQRPACLKIREREKAVRAREAAVLRQAQCEPLQWIAAHAPEETVLKMKIC